MSGSLGGGKDSKEPSIIIGIDFGTTYSGVAWTDSEDCQNIRVISTWSTHLRNCSNTEKVPTALSYNENGQVEAWGYDALRQAQEVRWFKLLLLEEKDVPSYVRRSAHFREAREYQYEQNQEPIDMVAAFLRRLWEHSLSLIIRELGNDSVERSKFHIVITVPAIWQPYAQERMRQAAQKAGLLTKRECGDTQLSLLSEPEAAALAVVSRLSKKSTVEASDRQIEPVGDTLVVCDAGGGTADLISYVVQSVTPFEVQECVKGAGDLCGGTFVDEEFLNLMQERLGQKVFGQFSKRETRKFLNDNWEHNIKPQFDCKQRSWLVEDLPAACRAPGRGQKRTKEIELSSDAVTQVFEPVVEKNEILLREQLAAIKAKYEEAAKASSPILQFRSAL
ncbi:hypothetical protein JDV02_001305 [Purpureocillium takamizusanense]|uniref:Uncharacterized protein n=1 Tax=Purpureocillium takamizusanense TaxID=2060973 RepID=A0A9Q8V6G4_9HYPO|nr:uncharacterized protein JDV02_001305 [Purpureocillium takamizusanense]UNI14703.1 hypothetical protein JDV02_001305 [Purpureocillium takamizusanense]